MNWNPTQAYGVIKGEIVRLGMIESTSRRYSLTEGLNMDGDDFNPKKSSVSTAYTIAHMPNSWGAIVLGIEYVDHGLGISPHIVVQYETNRRRCVTVYFDLYRDRVRQVDIPPMAGNEIMDLKKSIAGMSLED